MAKTVTKKKATTTAKKNPPAADKGDDLKDITDSFETKKMGEVTLKEFEITIKEFKEAKEAHDQAKLVTDKAKELVDFCGSRVMAIMQAFEKTSYKSTYGNVVRAKRFSYKTPKSEEERAAFFGFLKEKKLFDSMITVNSKALNSFCAKEVEAAIEAGDIDFTIPGLQEPTISETIALKR